MRGIHRVVIQNKRIRYDFEIRRNLTIIRGDSATGKTTMIDMVQEYINNGTNSSIELFCDKRCFVLEGVTWKGQLSEINDSIVFIDEGNTFVFTDEFAAIIQQTDNYYVIVSREGLPNLPYSVTEIYGIRLGGRYGGLKQNYNEFYRIYGETILDQEIYPDAIITEDSNSGYQFFKSICEKSKIVCLTSGGKSGLLLTSRKLDSEERVLLIADGAAFGPEMDRVMKYLANHKNIYLYVPESFEWLVLSSGVLKDSDVQGILSSTSDYVESRDYFSWERYFTNLLTVKTQGSFLQYSKRVLNPAYLTGQVRESILRVMQKIKFCEQG